MELQVSHLLENLLPRQPMKLRISAFSNGILRLLFLLLWLAPTIRWRIYLGSISFAFLEPVALLVIAVLVLNMLLPGKRPKLYVNSLILVLILYFMWLLIIRPWGQDWSHGLSDLRDWGIPTLTIIILLSFVKHGWRKWSLSIIPIAMLHASVGLYQHITDSFRPFASQASVYKLDYLSELKPAWAVGFFEHPNSFAVFLIIATTISIGWLADQKGIKRKLFPTAVVLFFFLILYWTYAKAELVTLVLMLLLFIAIPYIRSFTNTIALGSLSLIAMFIAGWFAINQWPVEFSTIWWRIDLWKSVFQTLSAYPGILLWGNGDVTYAALAIWQQPHNLFFDTLLNYGLVGLLLLLLLLMLIIIYGALSYKRGDMKEHPILRALWVSLLGFFVTGLVESSLIGIETRMIFLLLVACFIGLRRELTVDLRSG